MIPKLWRTTNWDGYPHWSSLHVHLVPSQNVSICTTVMVLELPFFHPHPTATHMLVPVGTSRRFYSWLWLPALVRLEERSSLSVAQTRMQYCGDYAAWGLLLWWLAFGFVCFHLLVKCEPVLISTVTKKWPCGSILTDQNWSPQTVAHTTATATNTGWWMMPQISEVVLGLPPLVMTVLPHF
jgi:hypothetical protein